MDNIVHIPDLSTASRLSRIWRPHAQKLQYKITVIKGPHSSRVLEDILSHSPSISDHVEVLDIHAHAVTEPIPTMIRICHRMINLCSLSLHEVDLEQRSDVPVLCRFIASFQHLSSLSFNKCIMIGDSLALIVEAATNLESLSLSDCDPMHGHRSIVKFPPPIPNRPLNFTCRVRTLSVDDKSLGRLNIFLRYPGVLSLVTHLSYHCDSSTPGRTFSDLLECIKENVEELEIIGGRSPDSGMPTLTSVQCIK